MWMPAAISYQSFLDELVKIAACKARMTVPQTRSGRRSMRVDTMLRKEKDGSLFKEAFTIAEAALPVAGLAGLVGAGLGAARSEKGERIGGAVRGGLGASTGALAGGLGGLSGAAAGGLDRFAVPGVALGALLGATTGYHAAAKRNKPLSKEAKDFGTNSAGFKLQGKVDIGGIPVAIENKKGSTREGKDNDGSSWKTKYKVPYGYIEDSKGADGDEVDAYVGPVKGSTRAYVVHQKKDDGSYDEDTVMLGFDRKSDAKKAILQHYDDPKYVGDIVTVGLHRLKELLSDGKKLTKISSKDERGIGQLVFPDRDQLPTEDVGGKDTPKYRDRTATATTTSSPDPEVKVPAPELQYS